MFKKASLIAAAGAGYVLGARAGRERYARIAASARDLAAHPQVERATCAVREKAPAMAGAVKEKMSRTSSGLEQGEDVAVSDTAAASANPGTSARTPGVVAGDEGLTKGALTPEPGKASASPARASPGPLAESTS